MEHTARIGGIKSDLEFRRPQVEWFEQSKIKQTRRLQYILQDRCTRIGVGLSAIADKFLAT